MEQKINIAIDGPAGCGKSTVAKIIAKKLNILYLDTGSMYRAIAYTAVNNNVEIGDNDEFNLMLDNINMDIKYIDGIPNIFVNDNNVSPYLRQNEIATGAAKVAKLEKVREKLVCQQKEFAKKFDVVMDGRDVGTNVLKESENKFFLTASIEQRAKRRFLEDQSISYEKILKDVEQRDKEDCERKLSPLVKAQDAFLIDTSELSVEQVAEIMIKRIEKNVL